MTSVFRRKKHGRTLKVWHFMATTRTGRTGLSTRTTSKPLAREIVAMWSALSADRCWDLLDPTLGGQRSISILFDTWHECEHDIGRMRRRFADTDLDAVVDDFLVTYRSGSVRPDTASHVETHCRWLLPTGTPRLASTVTPAWLEQRLAAYCYRRDKPTPTVREGSSLAPQEPPPPRSAKSNTRRKIHSSWSSFFNFARRAGVYAVSPMDQVARPAPQRSPIQFYEMDEVTALIGAAPNADMKALWALLYSTSIEITTALGLTRRDVDLESWEVRAAGTKATCRDRVVIIAEWARPMITAHLQGMLPAAILWPEVTRYASYTAHAAAAAAAGLRVLPQKNARHHWAVRACRAGTPISLVSSQLGHSSPQLALTTYGRFLPQASDRQQWETAATLRDRRQANT